MANYFPCPNPACTYQFDADQLPAAAMVTCPICRTRFPYRAAAPAAAPPVHEQAPKSSWGGQTEAAEPKPAARERVNRLVNPRDIPRSNKTQTILMILGFAMAGITLVAIVVISMKKGFFGSGNDEPGKEYTDENFNFKFKRFETKWREEPDLRGKFGMNGFMQKMTDSDAVIGLRCIEFDNGPRAPREGELENQMNRVLKNFTGVAKNPLKATIGKQSVDGYQFTGSLDDTAIWGEIYAFHYKGIGYVMVMWSRQDKWDTAQKELVALRDSFEFATIRDKIKEETSSKPYFVPNGDYEVIDNSKLWELAVPEPKEGEPDPKQGTYVRNATDQDDNATMLFRCLHPEHRNKARSHREWPADAMVLVLAKGSGTLEEIKKHVHDSLIKREEGRKIEFTFEPYPKLPFDYTMPATDAAIGTFRLANTLDKTKKFYAISVKKIGDHVVAVVGWCKEPDADYMGPYILRLAASLRERH